jgi:hypothetical protein
MLSGAELSLSLWKNESFLHGHQRSDVIGKMFWPASGRNVIGASEDSFLSISKFREVELHDGQVDQRSEDRE